MFFRLLAQVVTRRGWVVVASWVALAVGLALIAPNWRTISRDDDVRFYPPGYPTVVGQTLLERGFPLDVASSSFVVVVERRGGTLTVEDLEHLDGVSNALAALRLKEPELEIKTVTDRNTPIIGPRMVATNDGGQAALVNVALKTTYISKRTRISIDRLELFLEEEIPPAPPGLNLAWTGSAAVGHDMNEASNHSIETTTWTTVFLVVAILLVVYRSPLLAMIPLVTIAFSVFVSLRLIAAMTLVPGLDFQVINITPVFVTVILFGAGTDYCLFLIARYREELARGRGRTEAIHEAIRTVGGALIASAGTVIVGLGMLYFSSFAKIQYTGPSIALSLAIALLAALTLGPVFLNALRGAVFWPFKPPHHERGRDTEQEGLEQAPALGAWTTVADHVVKRPGLILGVSLVALAPLAYVGSQSKPGYSQIADLEASAPSRTGTRIVERYFAAGELGPVGILIDHPGLDFRSDAGVAAVEAFASRLATAPNVAEVRAVSRPLGRPLPKIEPLVPAPAPETEKAKKAESGVGMLSGFARLSQSFASGKGPRDIGVMALRAGADPRYVSTRPLDQADRNHITRVDVVFRSDPFSAESMAALRNVHEMAQEAVGPGGPLAGASVLGLAGTTAMVNDLADVTSGDERRMYVLVTLGVYAILVLLLRRPGICLYLIFTVVLGYLASLGLTELTFRWLNGAEPWLGLDWKVGFFLFVILVAVGEDYNIFLMARVVEEERKHGPIEGTRRAVAHTGGIISSCGLIMAGTFLSMLTGTLASLKQLGFALGVGVLLDTFIVRPVLVPAFVVLWHRARPRASLDASIVEAETEPEALEQGAQESPATSAVS